MYFGEQGDRRDDFARGILAEKWARQDSREERMKVNLVWAVFSAADEWVPAQEALVAAKHVSNKTEAEEETLADSRLVLAVVRWRASS